MKSKDFVKDYAEKFKKKYPDVVDQNNPFCISLSNMGNMLLNYNYFVKKNDIATLKLLGLEKFLEDCKLLNNVKEIVIELRRKKLERILKDGC